MYRCRYKLTQSIIACTFSYAVIKTDREGAVITEQEAKELQLVSFIFP